jgi:hypothetical protein
MPLVRTETLAYTELWNSHQIRKQPSKPNSVSGRPDQLYHYPELHNVVRHGRKIDPQLVQEIRDEFADWGMYSFIRTFLTFYKVLILRLTVFFTVFLTAYIVQISFYYSNLFLDPYEYLPSITLDWCQDIMRTKGYDLDTLERGPINQNGYQLHRTIFIDLRNAVRLHVFNKASPILSLCPHPIGGYSTIHPDSKFAELIRQNNGEYRTNQDNTSGEGRIGLHNPTESSEESGYGIADDFENIDPALLDIIAQLQVASVRGS